MKSGQKARQAVMTEGVIWRQILSFSMPLLIGNLFQQLYNTVDSVVVGNFIGSDALAAVGSSNSLVNLIIGMFMGIATGAGVLRAVGDSKRPLYFLCVSSVVNIILDLVFVIFFHMGTAGVGYATVIAQAISSALVVRALITTPDKYQLILSKVRVDRRMMVRILKLGIPSGIQQSIISLSNVIVQANINSFGAAAMAGFGSYSKIDGFAMLPLRSFCMAATTFTGQNIGAGKGRRIKEGIVQGIFIRSSWAVSGEAGGLWLPC